jgi:arabinan endo-1,5-alpha-L-arabinosidase
MKRNFNKIIAYLMVLTMMFTLNIPITTLAESVSEEVVSNQNIANKALAFYDFKDGLPVGMEAMAGGSTAIPSVVWDKERGYVLDLEFGAAGSESYVTFDNPYSNLSEPLDSASISLWVKVDKDAPFYAYDNLMGFYDGTKRFTLQTMPYLCWNDGAGNWTDLKSKIDPALTPGTWAHLAVTISTNSVKMYLNGQEIAYNFAGDGIANTAEALDTNAMLEFLKTSNSYLGYGSFWGTQDCYLDSVAFYNSALTAEEVLNVYTSDPSVTPGDIASGLTAHYSFDGALNNSVNNNLALEINGAGSSFGQLATNKTISYISGKVGKAALFAGGSSNGLKLPETLTSSNYTISFWMNPLEYTDYSSLIFATGASNSFVSIMGQGWGDTSSHPQIRYWRDSDNTNFVSGNTIDKVVAGTWTQITYVVEQTTGDDGIAKVNLTMYVDGEYKQVMVFPDLKDVGSAIVDFFVTNESAMYLGVNYWDSAFYGAMDELYLYDRALTKDDVAALYYNSVLSESEEDPIIIETKDRVSVHDPSIVKEGNTYYVFGSHIEAAKTTDLKSWTKFTNSYTTPNNVIFGDLSNNLSGSFAWAGENDVDSSGGFSVWAPDVFWNPTYMNEDGSTGAYMIYYSTTSTYKRSCLGFAVSDNIEGPYTYVDTIVYSGFTNGDAYDSGSSINTNYTNTNIKTLIEDGKLQGVNNSWFNSDNSYNTSFSPNAIDSELFYDENGKLWMVYGSWSGGIFLLEIDETTGKPIYPGVDGVTEGGNFVDRYFGTRIAGGYTKSGEGPYILYDNTTGYYYLYVTYGGLAANGGYNMRLFRSTNPDGPYLDAAGNNAVLPGRVDNAPYGIKLIGNYKFDGLTKGYKAAGHNSAFIDSDGQMYLVYHTRFDDGTEGHQVRIHQMYMNEDKWPVVVPYEYNGDLISTTGYTMEEVVGDYEFINHGTTNGTTMLDTLNVKLNEDFTISGDVSGNWSMSEGSYTMSLSMNDVNYHGVFFLQSDESVYHSKVMTFSAIGTNNESIWGSRLTLTDSEAVERVANNLINSIGTTITSDIILPTAGAYDTAISWSSNNPVVLSETGVIVRQVNDTVVTLTARITKNEELFIQLFNITVKGTGVLLEELDIEPIYSYSFNDITGTSEILNQGTKQGNALLVGNSMVTEDETRGKVLEIQNQANEVKVNYLALPSDTFDGITGEGYTVGMWVNVNTLSTGYSQHSALFEANAGGQDQYPLTRMSANLWARINANGAWADATTVSKELTGNTWQYVAYTVDTEGIKVYLDGELIGSVTADLTNSFTNNFLVNLTDVRVGSGNIWGDKDISDAKFDNVSIYNKALAENDIATLYQMERKEEVIVDEVTIDPITITVKKGSTYQFNATVTGTYVTNQSVIWAVSGSAITAVTGSAITTNIDSTGLLTIAEDETADILIITATSVEDNSKYGVAIVQVGEVTLEQVANPIISTEPIDVSGLDNNEFIVVTMVTATTGSAIYYTLDDTDPTTNSMLYDTSFTLSTSNTNGETIVIKAVAIKNGLLDSNIIQKNIIFLPSENNVTPTPTETPDPIITPQPTPTPQPTTQPTPTPTPQPTTTPQPTVTPTPTPISDQVGMNGLGDNVEIKLSVVEINDSTDISVEIPVDQLLKIVEESSTDDVIDISIPTTTDKILDLLSKSDNKEVNIMVTIPNNIQSNKNIQISNIQLDAKLLELAKNNGKDISIQINDENGKLKYSWSFTSANLVNSHKDITNVNLSLEVNAMNENEMLEFMNSDSDNNKKISSDGLIFNFKHHGILPSQAYVKIYVGDIMEGDKLKGFKFNKKVYIYYYNETTGKLETLPYSSNYKIDKEGYISIKLLHCSDYVVLPKKAKKDSYTSLRDQITVNVENSTLYRNKSKRKTTKIKVSLPDTLEVVERFSEKTSGNGVGGVTITYESSDSSVATVNSSGKVTSRNKGSAIITTTITLYSGKTKVVKTNITVK